MKKQSLFERLNVLMQYTQTYLDKAPWDNKEFYANWLAQTNYYTNHTTRLLSLCGALCPLDEQILHNRFLKHAAEEKGHENLSLLDLKNLKKVLSDYNESAATQAFYQIQYYWIEHHDPRAFFGFILFLEQLAAQFGVALAQKVTKAHGEKCGHFLKVHGEEDVDHVTEAVKNVEKMPEYIQALILKNMEQCSELYHHIVQNCIEQAMLSKSAA